MGLKDRKIIAKRMETGFNAVYLATVLIGGIVLLAGSGPEGHRHSFGIMAMILGLGDAFHLIPRIGAMWDKRDRDYTAMLGVGKGVTSVTMTVFYLLLWRVGAALYPQLVAGWMTGAMNLLAIVRIALCLMPQNRWTEAQGSFGWSVGRNIPFLFMGLAVTVLFARGAAIGPPGLAYLWLAVLFSFACYLPVVLLARRVPKVGMLMLPKSCAYAAIVLMGFCL